jgi:hypothetical protein
MAVGFEEGSQEDARTKHERKAIDWREVEALLACSNITE